MAIIFCDILCIILNYFVPPKTSVTGNYYATVIKSELLPAIKRKRPHFEKSGILLHHDNAQSHSSRIVMDTVNKQGKTNLKNRLRGNAVVKLGITVNLGILGYLKIDRVISRLPVPVLQMAHRLDWEQFSIKTKSF